MASFSLFTSETPTSIEIDATEYSLATIINGTVDAIMPVGRWYFGPVDPTLARYRVYDDESETLLRSADFPTREEAEWEESQEGWRLSEAFETPLTLTAPWRIRCTVNSSGRYPFRANVFPIAHDDLFAEDNSAPGGNAARVSVGDIYPTGGAGGTSCYFVDGVFVIGSTISAELGTATETDAALGLGRQKRRGVGIASNSEAAVALARSKARVVGLASDSEVALALGQHKVRTLGVAAGIEAARPLGRVKRRTLGVAVESDLALNLGGATVANGAGQIYVSSTPTGIYVSQSPGGVQ